MRVKVLYSRHYRTIIMWVCESSSNPQSYVIDPTQVDYLISTFRTLYASPALV
jgi:hypothetical protein